MDSQNLRDEVPFLQLFFSKPARRLRQLFQVFQADQLAAVRIADRDPLAWSRDRKSPRRLDADMTLAGSVHEHQVLEGVVFETKGRNVSR